MSRTPPRHEAAYPACEPLEPRLLLSNGLPTVLSLTSSAAVVNAGAIVSLTAHGVTDPDGTVAKVSFYCDDGDGTFNADLDTKLGQDTSAAGGWTLTAAVPLNSTPGTHLLFAQATDNLGGLSAPASLTVTVNAPPVVGALAATASELRGQRVTLTATGVTDSGPPAGTISKVEFFHDLNHNGVIDSTDTLLGTGVRQGATTTWALSPVTTGWAAGASDIIARATDNQGGTGKATTQTTVIDNAPVIGVLASNAALLNAGTVQTLTAAYVSDSDGTIAKVAFYWDDGDGVFDANTDTKLGEDTHAAGGWTFTRTTPAGLTPGPQYLFAQATDNDGIVSAAKAVLVTVNAPPVVGAVAGMGSALRGQNIQLVATNVADAGPPAGVISSVQFFRDVNHNGVVDAADKFLGTGTRVGTWNTWTLSTPTTGWATGSNDVIARATDNQGGTGLAVGHATVIDNAPVVGVLTVPATMYGGAPMTLTAGYVSDADGTIAKVAFYLDDGDGMFDATKDTKLGEDASAAGGWKFTGTAPMNATPGTQFFFAQTTDNDGTVSVAKGAYGTVLSADLVSLLGYKQTGSWKDYASTYRDSLGTIVTSTATTAFSSDDDGWLADTSYAGLTSNKPDVTSLPSYSMGFEQENGSLSVTPTGLFMQSFGLPVTASAVQIGGPILGVATTGSAPISVSAGPDFQMAGTLKITTSLGGLQRITVPAGTYDAYTVTIVMTSSMTGTYTDSNTLATGIARSSETDTLTFYVVPDVGVVQQTTVSLDTLAMSTHGTETTWSVDTHALLF